MTKQEVITYLKSNEFDSARANAAFMFCEIAFGAYVESDKIHHSPFSPSFCYLWKEDATAFHQIIARHIIADTGKRLYQDYCKDPKTLDEKIKEHLHFEAGLDFVWQKYFKVRGKASPKELSPIFRELLEYSIHWWYYGAIGEDKGGVIHTDIVPKFAERHHLSLSDADHLFNTLSHPETKTILNIEREYFLNICLKLSRKESTDALVKKYLGEFFWFKSDFYKAVEITSASLLSDAQKYLAEKGAEGIQAEFDAMQQNFARLHEERTSHMKDIVLTDEDKRDLAFAEKNILWIDYRKRGMMKDFYYLVMIITNVAQQVGMRYSELSAYMSDEFAHFLETGERVSKEIIDQRNEGVFAVWEKGKKRQLFYGADAHELFKVYSSLSNDTEVKGQVASRGGVKSVSGVVRIIHQPDTEVFNEGEILVTSMTRIEFVPLMRKAKAIITDEGRIACHAAIVSRELGLPCVIGTRIGTKVLKTGDTIEIDLEKGIVTILKHA